MKRDEGALQVNERHGLAAAAGPGGLVDYPADLRSARDGMAPSRGDDYYTFSSGASVCPYSEGAPGDSRVRHETLVLL